MAPTLRCLAILHTIISFLCVVGYYYLKVQQRYLFQLLRST